MKITSFEDIESWQYARILTNQIYKISNSTKLKNDFGLRDQIRRATVSIMSNIAEGFDSKSNKSFINFLNYSYRSTSEVQSLLYVSIDQHYISKTEFENLYKICADIKGLIGGFTKYLKTIN